MRADSQDIFAVKFRNVAGKALFGPGGLKFEEEAELRRRYATALEDLPLETLLGEATLWVLWPSTAAIWLFPVFLLRFSIDFAALFTIGVFLAVQVAHMTFYNRRLNYVLLVLGNRALHCIYYVVWAVAFWRMGSVPKVIALAVWLPLMAFGILQVIFLVPFVPILKRVFERRPADQALSIVARYHERRSKPPV
jgi:hypothetical protein